VRRTRLKSVGRVSRNLRCTRTSKSQLFWSIQSITQGVKTPPRRLIRLAILPPNLFDMLVGFGGQAMATTQASALEHLASSRSRHALAETMYAHAATDFGLIRSFRHIRSSHKKIIAFPDIGNPAA